MAGGGLLVNVCAGNGPSAESTQRCFVQLWHIPSSARACPKGPASRCLFMAHTSRVQTTACSLHPRAGAHACTCGQEHTLFC